MNETRRELGIKECDGTIVLTLNRPERRNALSLELLKGMDEALARIAEDRSARVLIIRSTGDAFSAGHDLEELARESTDLSSIFSTCTRVMSRFRALPIPVIARVQGPALAAGCQLVAACDLAVAADSASFGTPGVKIGLFCTTPMVPLVRTVAPRAALEMLLTGRPISATRAWELGLVNRVVPPDRLDQEVEEMVAAVKASSPTAIRMGKKAFYEQLSLTEPEAYSCAEKVMITNVRHADAAEGIRAFLDKRPPKWTSEGS